MKLSSRRYGWYVLGVLAFANFLNYGNRNVVQTMYPEFRARFLMTDSELGLLMSVFMATHALVTLPVGWAADRFDRRRVIAFGAVVWSLAAVAGGIAESVGTLLWTRAIGGIGTAACVPVVNALVCDVFASEEKGARVSVFNVGLFLGGAVGFGLGAVCGYPLALWVVGIPGFLVAALVLRLEVPSRAQQTVSFRQYARSAWASLVRSRVTGWLLLAAVCMSFAAGGYLAWFAEFIAETKGMSILDATIIFGLLGTTGGLAGVLTGGIVGDRLHRHRPAGRLLAIAIGFAATVPCALIAIWVDISSVFYIASWFTMYFVTWYHGPLAASVDDFADEHSAATAQSVFIFGMHLFGTAPAPWLIGIVSDRVGLRWALVIPTGMILIAAVLVVVGWRSAVQRSSLREMRL